MKRKGTILLLREAAFASCLAAVVVIACNDQPSSDIRRWAEYWVQRENDTLATDQVAPDSLTAVLPDSAWLDSLARTWTTEDWLLFWAEVEKQQQKRRQEPDTARTGE